MSATQKPTAQHTPEPFTFDETNVFGPSTSFTVATAERAATVVEQLNSAWAHEAAIKAELLAALKASQSFINSFKSCVPDWAERMAVKGEGYSANNLAAIAKATGGAS